MCCVKVAQPGCRLFHYLGILAARLVLAQGIPKKGNLIAMNGLTHDERTREKKRFSSRWKLFIYDLIACLVLELLLLLVYRRALDSLQGVDILLHMLLCTASIFGMRLAFQVYRQIWRYGGIQSYIRLLVADFCAGVLYNVLQRLLPIQHVSFLCSVSVSCTCLLICLTMRMVYRYAYKCCKKDSVLGKILGLLIRVFASGSIELGSDASNNKIRIAIVGAGRVGVSLAEELMNSASAAYTPRCFVDTNEEKVGRSIYNVPVFDERDVTQEMLDHLGIQEIVFALPLLCADEKQKLYHQYKQFGRKIKVYDYPVMQQVGEGSRRYLREFDIEELLFRKPIMVTNEKTDAFYLGKVVLITGGGGSIGSELCRQIAKMQPKQLIILDVYENGAYDIQQELRIAYGEALDLRVEILSVCNREALEKIFSTYRPDVVLHAAAHKHVPLMEHNCCEAIENNVFGTLNTVELAEKYRVGRFMMVSTDKAVNPTNVMGATKRMCEMIVQSHSGTSVTTTFSATRFGNVLGSAGSVIPLFRRQIMNDGPITVTDKRIIRYFMTIPEASQLVLQAGAMAKNGELFVLDMGRPVKILELAENMVRLSGFEPYRDINIVETGLRPGEKLYEELLVKTEELDKTENSLIFIERDDPIGPDALKEKLEVLRAAVVSGNNGVAKQALHDAVPTFRTPEEVNRTAQRSEEMRIAAGV